MSRSGYTPCQPVQGQGPCTCNKYGLPIKIYKKCDGCLELRCRSHCGCARRAELQGRCKARPGPYGVLAAPKAVPKLAPKPQAAPKLSSTSAVKVFKNGSGTNWIDALIKDVRVAKQVSMCIYCYDDPDLHKTLLPMVKAGMALRLVVDRRYFAQRTAYFQYPRLKALRDADADVMDASGDNGGNMHYKVVVLHGDGWAAAYHGGCNATKASRDSWESMVRFAEPAIVATFQSMCDECFAAAAPCKF